MKTEVKILLLGVAALLILAAYSYSDFKVASKGAELRKADFASLYSVPDDQPETVEEITPTTPPENREKKRSTLDTVQNILFIGDSMLEGLCRRFIDYADQNGHVLNTVVWYSSSSKLWAETDTLQYFLKKFEPTYVVICLCSNELFVKDVPERKKNIQKIVKKLEGRPYVWISPPNWKDDTGINDAIISVVGKERYFDSRSLQLERGKDHAHPTFPAAAIWMDTIARWIKSDACADPIMMEWPEKDVGARNVTVLQPYRE